MNYESYHIEKSYLTLDFAGTPKLVIKKKNTFSYEHSVKVRVTYRFNQMSMLTKPLILSMTVFMFYLIGIISNRIKLSFNDKAGSDQKKKSRDKTE